jgi:hypothetical protein
MSPVSERLKRSQAPVFGEPVAIFARHIFTFRTVTAMTVQTHRV